jgi:hypothetical protein
MAEPKADKLTKERRVEATAWCGPLEVGDLQGADEVGA